MKKYLKLIVMVNSNVIEVYSRNNAEIIPKKLRIFIIITELNGEKK